MVKAETGFQHAVEDLGEREVVEADAAGEAAIDDRRAACVPSGLPVSRMDDERAVLSWRFGEWAGEAGMQPDVDETAVRLQDTANLPRQGGEVVHVGVREGRGHQVEGGSGERGAGLRHLERERSPAARLAAWRAAIGR